MEIVWCSDQKKNCLVVFTPRGTKKKEVAWCLVSTWLTNLYTAVGGYLTPTLYFRFIQIIFIFILVNDSNDI